MKTNKKLKALLSSLLAICLILGMLPMGAISAFAADGSAFTADGCAGANQNGFCSECDGYEAPKLVEGVYDVNDDGTKDNAYEISNAGQLYWFASQVNGGNNQINGVLTCDITVNPGVFDSDGNYTPVSAETPRQWTPIGNSSKYFKGNFDGRSFAVSGLYFNNTAIQDVGFFGNIDDSNISDLSVKNSYFKANYRMGGISGATSNSTISGCSFEGAVAATNSYNGFVGGICGKSQNNSKIINCINKGMLSGFNYIGGICGYVDDGTSIYNCFNTSNLEVSYNKGKIFGVSKGTVLNCYYVAAAESESDSSAKTEASFKSGEVAYLLQRDLVYDGATKPQVWGQTIGVDDYPVLGGEKVERNSDGTYYNPAEYWTDPGNYDISWYDSNATLFTIKNAEQLAGLAVLVNGMNGETAVTFSSKTIILSADIDLSGKLWKPIGATIDGAKHYFRGSFSGQSKTISNMKVNATDEKYAGLFGSVAGSANIRDLTVKDAQIICDASATTANNYYSGGIAGEAADSAMIMNCNVSGKVQGEYTVGGIVGDVWGVA